MKTQVTRGGPNKVATVALEAKAAAKATQAALSAAAKMVAKLRRQTSNTSRSSGGSAPPDTEIPEPAVTITPEMIRNNSEPTLDGQALRGRPNARQGMLSESVKARIDVRVLVAAFAVLHRIPHRPCTLGM